MEEELAVETIATLVPAEKPVSPVVGMLAFGAAAAAAQAMVNGPLALVQTIQKFERICARTDKNTLRLRLRNGLGNKSHMLTAARLLLPL